MLNETEAGGNFGLVTDKGQTADEFRFVARPFLIGDLRAVGNTGTHDSVFVKASKAEGGVSECSQIGAWHGLANVSMEGAPNLRVDIWEEREVVYLVLVSGDGGIVEDRSQVNWGAALPPADQPCTE